MQWKLIQVQGEFRRRSPLSKFDDDNSEDDDSVLSAAVNVRLAIHVMQYVSTLHPA